MIIQHHVYKYSNEIKVNFNNKGVKINAKEIQSRYFLLASEQTTVSMEVNKAATCSFLFNLPVFLFIQIIFCNLT